MNVVVACFHMPTRLLAKQEMTQMQTLSQGSCVVFIYIVWRVGLLVLWQNKCICGITHKSTMKDSKIQSLKDSTISPCACFGFRARPLFTSVTRLITVQVYIYHCERWKTREREGGDGIRAGETVGETQINTLEYQSAGVCVTTTQ